jgi:Asp-tRNA(Asn)/Glu-tRNA(Gln) amidotransferase A subunit family amidase
VKSAFELERENQAEDEASLEVLRSLGATLIPIELPDYPSELMMIILQAEAAAAFDELTRSDQDDLLVRQEEDAWPNVFRSARFIPAVEYIQANRLRALMMQEMEDILAGIDLYVAPSFAGDNLWMTNLTGHPAVVVPNGFAPEGAPSSSICFMGKIYDETTPLTVAAAYQAATDFHLRRPPMDWEN